MSSPEELQQELQAQAGAADALDPDAIWARVSTGISHRRRRRRAAASIGAVAVVAMIAVGASTLERPTLRLGPAPVATAPPTSATPEPPSPPPASPSAATRPTDGRTSTGSPSRVPPQALVPAATQPRATADGAVAWALPEACAVAAPSTATAMVTIRDGTGEFEAQVGVQQVALFPDAAAAIAEVDRVRQSLAACAASTDLVTVDDADVGAQGTGIARAYADDQGAPSIFGTYTVLTRRGTAVTLVGVEGGDGSPESSRDPVLQRARQAWERLCAYDSAGC